MTYSRKNMWHHLLYVYCIPYQVLAATTCISWLQVLFHILKINIQLFISQISGTS